MGARVRRQNKHSTSLSSLFGKTTGNEIGSRLVRFYSRPPTLEYEIPFLKTDQSQLTSHILENWPLTITIYAREYKHKHGGY